MSAKVTILHLQLQVTQAASVVQPGVEAFRFMIFNTWTSRSKSALDDSWWCHPNQRESEQLSPQWPRCLLCTVPGVDSLAILYTQHRYHNSGTFRKISVMWLSSQSRFRVSLSPPKCPAGQFAVTFLSLSPLSLCIVYRCLPFMYFEAGLLSPGKLFVSATWSAICHFFVTRIKHHDQKQLKKESLCFQRVEVHHGKKDRFNSQEQKQGTLCLHTGSRDSEQEVR